jgi:hypothetical protein
VCFIAPIKSAAFAPHAGLTGPFWPICIRVTRHLGTFVAPEISEAFRLLKSCKGFDDFPLINPMASDQSRFRSPV